MKNKAKLFVCRPQELKVREIIKETSADYDVEIISMELHANVEKLREHLQNSIDNLGDEYTAVCLCMGLCGGAVKGLVARRIPIFLLRAHDCITFALGSRERYMKLFREMPGTYFFTPGWLDAIKNREADSEQFILDPAGRAALRQSLIEAYGEDNGEFLFEMETAWIKNYRRALFIGDSRSDNSSYLDYLSGLCSDSGWELCQQEEDYNLLERFLNRKTDSDDFLVVKPGYEIYETGDERVIDGRPV